MYQPKPLVGSLAFTGAAIYVTLGAAVAVIVIGSMILALLGILPRLRRH